MKLHYRLISVLLIICMLIPMVGFTYPSDTQAVIGDPDSGFTVINADGSTESVDQSWVEDYPYGVFALGHSELTVAEGGQRQVLTVYRLGGTQDKVSAAILYQPAVVLNSDGTYGYSSAISYDDIVIEVEDPLPITAYQPWGIPPAPEATDIKLKTEEGTDGEGKPCLILSPDTAAAGISDCKWYVLINEEWQSIVSAGGSELPVGSDELDTYDFRCEFTLGGTTYCTDSVKGAAYEKTEQPDVPEAPDDIELNPEPTFSVLVPDEGSGEYDGLLFEVRFANGEYKKDIIITAKDDSETELDEFAAFTITGCVGGVVHQSINTLMLRIEDNDGGAAEPSTVGFAVENISFDKSEGKAAITVKRSGGIAKALSVDWVTEDGTARAGTDYVGNSGSLYFYGDQTEQIIEIDLINDKIEETDEKQFTVRLENLLGDDNSSIGPGICAVGLYNTNSADTQNLASILYDTQAIDISSGLPEVSAAPVSSGVITGTQVVPGSADLNSGPDGLDPLLYKVYDPVYFSYAAGVTPWSSSTSINFSLKNSGNASTRYDLPNMGKLFTGMSATVRGGAKFASAWDRVWYGDEEYAYTYFQRRFEASSLGYWNCSPSFQKTTWNVYLYYSDPFYASQNWAYNDSGNNFLLGIATHESRSASEDINASASVTLYRRAFNNNFGLNIYTANDADSTGVTKFSDYGNLISGVKITNGGTTYDGKLYEGSSVQVQLADSHLWPVKAYIVDKNNNNNRVFEGNVSASATNRTATFNNIMLPPDGSYTFEVVLDRRQDIEINVTTSSEVDSSGQPLGGADEANRAAYELLLSKNTDDGNITVGYTPQSGNYFGSGTTETRVSLNTGFAFDASKGIVTTANKTVLSNIQYINFHLTENDVIVINGKAYAGNDNIPLEEKNLKTKNLQFYFYEEAFLTAQRPMKATIDATALYFDGNGNGRIDGVFNVSTGVFTPDSGDLFVAYLDDIDYEETTFRPVIKDGKVCQYFLRPYYTANPVSLSIPEGHSSDERMQILPNFICDVTDSGTYEALSDEQKQYRTIESGITSILSEGSATAQTGYTSDNKLKYTAAASAYSYIDIPLGGDLSPARPVKSADLGTNAPQNGQYTVNTADGIVKYMLKDGLAYYYSETAPGNLGDAVYTWTPDYMGNLLFKFNEPKPIFIAHSLAGDRIPVTSDLTTWYQKTDDSWTKTAPASETESQYNKNEAGTYITETRAGENGITALNSYLGAFGGDDTFALVINEQTHTTDKLTARPEYTESITRGTVGSYPDASYLQQNKGSQNSSKGDSGGEGEYDEFSSDADTNMFSFDSKLLSLLGVTKSGYEISFSVGIPLYSKDSDGKTGSPKDIMDKATDMYAKVANFIFFMKNPQSGSSRKDAFSELAGEDLDPNKLKSKSVEFKVSISLAIKLKYNPLDNAYMFSEAALAATVGIELRLQYRFTPVPIFYVYAQFGAEGKVSTGLGQNRNAIMGDVIVQNRVIELYEKPASGQSRQYIFATDKKAFSITFTGKLYMECYEYTDEGDGKFGPGDIIGDAPEGFKAGYISSDGTKATEIVLKGQDGFTLAKPVIVMLSVVDDKNPNYNATASITGITLINGVDQEFYWSGFKFEITGTIELGIGVGVEIAKIEIYAKASIGFAFSLGVHQGGGEYTAAAIDEFKLAAGLGFRIVLLFFSYEMDLIEYHLNYSGETDKWTHGWSALGGMFGGDSDLGTQASEDGKVHVYITPPSMVQAKIYGNNVTGLESGMDDMAYDSHATEFQVSGYGSSVNAFKLMDEVTTGYDYRIVTVSGENYVVYTGSRGSGSAAVDNTLLMLSKLEQSDNEYGFVNPVAGSGTSDIKSIPVDNDEAGDLDFFTWADGKYIHVVWVSYENKTTAPIRPEGEPYKSGAAVISEDNYLTIGRPAGGVYSMDNDVYSIAADTLTINGQSVTAKNYGSIAITPVSEPVEDDYYSTTEKAGWKSEADGGTTYYYPSQYADLAAARQAYQNQLNKYDVTVAAQAAYANWTNYYKWYNYYYFSDVQNQVVEASRNTVVKHAVFDTDDTEATGFVGYETVGDSGSGYYFLPNAAKDAVVYAQSVPYSPDDLEAQLQSYRAYLDSAVTSADTDGSSASESYIEATKEYRMAYQRSMLSVYGGNSMLTVTAPDGTPYANGVMYVSRHQEDGYGTAQNQTNEILTNLQVTEIAGAYYLAYVTRQDAYTGEGANLDISSISRLYLRRFTIITNGDNSKEVVWGEPYLLRTVVNNEKDSAEDGVYNSQGGITKGYIDPYIANLSFLHGALGDKLPGTAEDFEPFGTVAAETFLLFEMNGNTYVIDQGSLVSITDPGVKSGIIHPFFTYEQLYGDALSADSTENLSSGKSEVVIGTDGDGNVAAVYIGSVPNTVNNAIYIAYWDPENGAWSDGVMLAMNYMEVYERSVAENWDAETTEAAYFDENLGGGLTRFSFSNLQIALGRGTPGGPVVGESGILSELDDNGVKSEAAESASAVYSGLISQLGLPSDPGSLGTLIESYSKADMYALKERAELLGFDTCDTSTSPELLILTSGLQQLLDRYSSAADPSKDIIAPKRGSDKMPIPGNLGVYVISYGKGEQQVGDSSIRFSYNEFSVGSQLHAILGFKNVGDAAIRGSEENPVTVNLMLKAGSVSDIKMAEWKITQNIGAGQTVRLSTDEVFCPPLNTSLGEGDYFYFTVSEDKPYIESTGGIAYIYNSYNDSRNPYQFNIENKPELGIEGFKASVSGVEQDGKVSVYLDFDATNRGSEKAEEVFVQLSYVSGYETDGTAVYTPLDLSDSEIYVSQQRPIADGLDALGTDNLSIGVIYLGTDTSFYSADYYITKAEYDAILSNYYSLNEKAGWARGTYNGVAYYYDQHYYISAYAAYTAGQEAVKSWSPASPEPEYYYNNRYASYDAARAAADAKRMEDYLLTKAAYDALPIAQKEAWVLCADNSSYYTLGVYGTYSAAYAAYQRALDDDTQDIISNYRRTVSGTARVSPDCFRGKITGSLDIRAEIFSGSSSAGSSGGLYSSDHSDEYYAYNNSATVQVEHTSFISAAPKITLPLGSTFRLPVSVRTTTGAAPVVSVIESEDGNRELSTLYYVPDTDADEVPSTATGAIVIVSNKPGSGVIHVLDSAANTTYPIAFRVTEADSGINIFNDDAQFNFFNIDDSPYNEDNPNQDWRFVSQSSWTEAMALPYLSNVAVGEEGAYFTFETKAETISFNMIGDATVTSNKFAGVYNVSNPGVTAPPTTETVNFRNPEGISHIIKVKVTSGTAYFDTVKITYGEGYTPPNDDRLAPGLYWSRSFPIKDSVAVGEEPAFTVYAIDESGLQSLSFNGVPVSGTDIRLKKLSEKVWSYSFTVKENINFSVSAVDTNGNTTTRLITVDWFKAVPTNPADGGAPSLTATAVKTAEGKPSVDLFGGGAPVTITSDEMEAGSRIKLTGTTTDADLSYYVYNKQTYVFDKMSDYDRMPEAVIYSNGCYMVRADSTDADSLGTWTARIFVIDCFEAIPEIDVSRTELTSPNGYRIDWLATKNEESTAKLSEVTLNGISIFTGLSSGVTAASDILTVYCGGQYIFRVTDTKGLVGMKTLNLEVPVDISADGVIAYSHPWSQPAQGESDYGVITVNAALITGGEYSPSSAAAAVSVLDYRGEYEAVLVRDSDVSGALPGDGSLTDGESSWLNGLVWVELSDTYTWDNLKAEEDGEGTYYVIIRDAQNPMSYSAMAYREVTIYDNSVDFVSLSSGLASSPTAADGRVYVSADKGDTGTYEFAILPLEKDTENSTDTETVYKPRTAEDFKTADWQLSYWGGAKDAVLTGLAPGRYQVAIRSLHTGDGRELREILEYNALGTAANEALSTLRKAEADLLDDAESMSGNILKLSSQWLDISNRVIALDETYEKLRIRRTAGDPSVSAEAVATAYNNLQEAMREEDEARLAFRAAFTGASDEQKTEFESLRSQWLTSTDNAAVNAAKAVFQTAVYDFSHNYCRQYHDSIISDARSALNTAESSRDNKAAEITGKSARKYSEDSLLWDGMLTGAALQINVGSGSGTSVIAKPAPATQAGGNIRATASGGTAYDGGDRVNYQFALLPLPNIEAAADYTDMTRIAELDLDWRFADDPGSAYDQTVFSPLDVGWYQVFVRVVYDDDPNDSYDVNTALYDPSGNTADLTTLKKAYDTAGKAAQESSISNAANAAHALFLLYQSSLQETYYNAYLSAIGNDSRVIDALNEWLAARGSSAKDAALETYLTTLKAYFREIADTALSQAALPYFDKLAELQSHVDKVYAENPSFYDTASYAVAYVSPYVAPKVKFTAVYDDGKVTFVFNDFDDLKPEDVEKIVNDNRLLETHLILADRHVIVLAGTLSGPDEVLRLIYDFTDGPGNTVKFTGPDKKTIVVPISLVEGGMITYLYLGEGSYAVADKTVLFRDTEGHWAKNSISFAAVHGLFEGVGDNMFAPKNPMTRSMLVTVLYRLLGQPPVSGSAPFSDVADGTWYTDAVIWAYSSGIIDGVGNNLFATDRPITRAELVTMLYRFMKSFGFAASGASPLEGFADYGDVPSYANEAFKWAVYTGIITGNDKNELLALSSATRAEVAAVFERMIRYIISQ